MSNDVDRSLPIGTYAFGKLNPWRWHVVMAGGNHADVWMGTHLTKTCETFDEAIEAAQALAHGSQP